MPFDQVFARWRGVLERPCGADVVGGDHVAQYREDFGVYHVVDVAGILGHALEVGRVLHVGRRGRPVVGFASGCFHPLPFFVTFEDVSIFADKRFAGYRFFDKCVDLG